MKKSREAIQTKVRRVAKPVQEGTRGCQRVKDRVKIFLHRPGVAEVLMKQVHLVEIR